MKILRTFAMMSLALACSMGVLADAQFTLEIVDAEPPADLRDSTKSELVPRAYRISDGDGLFYEFWFVKGLTASEKKEKVKDTLDNPGTAKGRTGVKRRFGGCSLP